MSAAKVPPKQSEQCLLLLDIKSLSLLEAFIVKPVKGSQASVIEFSPSANSLCDTNWPK